MSAFLRSIANGSIKTMLALTNQLEIRGFKKIESHLQKFPFPCEEDNEHMKILRWQLREAEPVNIQGPRIAEQFFSYMGGETVMLTRMLKDYSPLRLKLADPKKQNQMDAEDPWRDEKQLLHSDIHETLTTSHATFESLHGFRLDSVSGLEWFFGNRLGALYLKKEKATGLWTATLDSTTKYEVKPRMARFVASISFEILEDTYDLNFQSLSVTFPNEPTISIHKSYISAPSLSTACKYLYSGAIMDCAINFHAVLAHMCVGEVFNSATVRILSCSNPLRKFLHPLTHGVFEISNVVRMVLVPEFGTLHTLFPFTIEGLEEQIHEKLASFDIFDDLCRPDGAPSPLFVDMQTMWDDMQLLNQSVMYTMVRECTVKEKSEMIAWMEEIARLQPNDRSRARLLHQIHSGSGFLNNPEDLLLALVNRFMFHSVVTHNLASLTNDLVSDSFQVPTMIESPLNRSTTKQTSERTMIAAHSSDLQVLKFDQHWGDRILPHVKIDSGSRWATLKKQMNGIPKMLANFEDTIKHYNKTRKYPCDALNRKNLLCSISV